VLLGDAVSATTQLGLLLHLLQPGAKGILFRGSVHGARI
jgi:hypothetical protein